MSEEERFDPSRHSLADAAKRLKEISEKDYSRRLADVLGRHEEEDTSELHAGDTNEQNTDKQPVALEPGKPITMVPGHPVAFHVDVDYSPMNPNPTLGATNIMAGTYNWNTGAANPWIAPMYSQPIQYAPAPEPLTEERILELLDKPQPIRLVPAPDPWTEERIQKLVAETMKKMLYPDSDGIVTHQHRRVRQWDETGQEWRGVLYKVEKEDE